MMIKFAKVMLIFFISIQLVSCVSTNKMPPQNDDINLQPMYGGVEKTPQQKRLDDAFIASIVQKTGNRWNGSMQVSQLGWSYLQKGDWETAMRRFNQAWLLDQDNYEAYWGFAAILDNQGKYADACAMGEKALSLAPGNTKVMCDVAFGYSNYAYSMEENQNERDRYFKKAISLYEQAAAIDPNYSCIYNHWAITLFYTGEYQAAWEKVKKSEELGFNFSQGFLDDLTEKMPRPEPY
ncbi:MAG: tetratricopeptide repeat protein [Thermodesulfobacteriota bacterium]